MRKTICIIFAVLLLFPLLSGELIERIVVEGNRKVSRDTVLFYLKSKANDLYSEDILREDFQTLWKTGFFENIRIETEQGPRGVIIKITLSENLFIREINYKTGKKIKKEDIVEKLQENGITLSPYSYFDPAKLKKVESIILEMMAEKGYNEGKVDIATTSLSF